MTPFNCSPFGYQFSTSTLIQLDLVTGQSQTLGNLSPANNVNAVGYNETDGYMYGYNITTNRVAKIGLDLQLQDLPAVANLPVQSWNVGDVDENGYLYMSQASQISLVVVDVNPSSANYGKLVDPATKVVTTTISTLTGAIGGASIGTNDWAFNPVDGDIYYVKNSDGVVRKVNPNTGVVTSLTTVGAASGTFGAMFFDPGANLYAVDNTTGAIYKYAISGVTATRSLFSNAGLAGSGDGARCAKAPINFAYINAPITKTATGIVAVGETITYTVVVNNSGNISADNIIIFDTIPNETIFDSNSIKLNGVTKPGNPSPPTGVNIGTIGVGVSTVTFTVTATTIPSINPVQNIASLQYEFTDPATGFYNSNAQSTIATTTIVNLSTTTTKVVDKAFAKVGDTLTYTVVVTPSGNITSISSVFIDTIPSGTSLISNTLNQDGTLISGNPSPPGVNLPSALQPGITTTISFKVAVTTIPIPNPIPNNSALSFNFQGNSVVNGGSTSNSVFTQINQVYISSSKNTNKSYGDIGDTITYTIVLTNSGTTTATNVLFSDTIPNGGQFITNSVNIDSINKPGFDPAPPLGFTIPDISKNSAVTIEFLVQITTIPSPNPMLNSGTSTYDYTIDPINLLEDSGSTNTNSVSTLINTADVTVNKSVNKENGTIGDVISYTFVLTNIGTTTTNNTTLIDTIPADTTFINNSLKLNGITQIGVNPLPPTGFNLNTLAPLETATITFDVSVVSLPLNIEIFNSGEVEYSYTVIPTIPNGVVKNTQSNTVATNIVLADFNGITKYVDKYYTTCGETITYTIVIPNSGNVTALNVILRDTIPNGTTLVTDSVYVNDVQQIGANLSTGITLPDTAPAKSITITFKVVVIC